MSGAFCPACGVAVVPGYVRCPKCHKPLPRRTPAAVVGGTAVEPNSRGPLLAIIGGALLLAAIVIYFGMRSKKVEPRPTVTAPTQAPPTQTAAPQPEPAQLEARPIPKAGPDPNAAAGELERALRKQRLWSTVSVEGFRVDVRSGSCSDPGMAPLLDASAASFKAAGLTQLRCLEQSGRVVTARDL